MRLTCLKCGHQFEVACGAGGQQVGCICGTQFELPEVLYTGTQPNERAAERSRHKAFRAAGLVRNVGGVALGLAVLGVLFFPLGLVGAGVGVYTLIKMRGPVGRYSGREWAIAGIVLGIAVFAIEGLVALDWLDKQHHKRLVTLQKSAGEDLKRLRRAQILYRAANSTYGSFSDFRFRPGVGRYTIYLGPDDYYAGTKDGVEDVSPLPPGVTPEVGEADFTAVAVANLDDDDELDIWVMTADGAPRHVFDDLRGAPPEEPEVSTGELDLPPQEGEEPGNEDEGPQVKPVESSNL